MQKFDINSEEQFLRDIKSAKSQLKGYEVTLQIVEKQMSEIKTKPKTKQTEGQFLEGIAILSQNHGRIPLKETTLMEYAGMIRFNNKQAKK